MHVHAHAGAHDEMCKNEHSELILFSSDVFVHPEVLLITM